MDCARALRHTVDVASPVVHPVFVALGLTLGVTASVGCVQGGPGPHVAQAAPAEAAPANPAPAIEGSDSDVAASVGEGGAGASAPANAAVEPEPEPEPPAPVVADSKIVTKVVVDPAVQPGLLAFSQELASKGSLWIGPLEGNGGRDVLVYVPPGADDAAPFELVYHFHGTYSEHVEKQRDGLDKKKWVGWDRLTQTLEAIDELQLKRSYNVAVVYPFSAGKRLEPGHKGWSNVAYDRMWMDPAQPPDYRDDFAKLHAEVEALLVDEFGVHPSKLPADVVAEGHSAGGIALRNIAMYGAPKVRELIYLDASFQGWADAAYKALKELGAKATLTLVVTEKGIADPFVGRSPWCTELEQDAAVWAEQRGACKGQPEREVPGTDWTCAELEEREQEWRDDYEDWCAAMKDDMRSVPEVTVVKTKVPHGKQPREFAGGLNL